MTLWAQDIIQQIKSTIVDITHQDQGEVIMVAVVLNHSTPSLWRSCRQNKQNVCESRGCPGARITNQNGRCKGFASQNLPLAMAAIPPAMAELWARRVLLKQSCVFAMIRATQSSIGLPVQVGPLVQSVQICAHVKRINMAETSPFVHVLLLL